MLLIISSYTFYGCKNNFIQKSQASNKSKSLKSKYVAKKTEIDEALFGINILIKVLGLTNPNVMKSN